MNESGSGNKATNQNRHIPTWAVGLAAFVFCWATLVTYYHLKFDLNIPPSTSGDEVDYDSLAWELAHARGFSLNTSDPAFRAPYDRAAQTEDRFKLPSRPNWTVTYRPPLYPFAMSFLNQAFGRQFWATRIMDAALMAATLALIVITLYPRYRWLSAVIAVGLFTLIDTRVRLYGRAILTESMSLFLTSLLCFLLLKLLQLRNPTQRQMHSYSIIIGITFGLSLLTRTMMILWLPGLCIILLWISWKQKVQLRTSCAMGFLFIMSLGCTLCPWAIRNIQTTGKLMPLGTQGLVQLSAGFGDSIWKSGGLWTNIESEGFFDEIVSKENSPLENEILKAEYSKAEAVKWIAQNPSKSLLLAPMKIYQECIPRHLYQWFIMILMLLGIWSIGTTAEGKLFLGILVTNLIAIAATWSVEGRFLVPVLFPIHIFATVGSLWIMQKLTGTKLLNTQSVLPHEGQRSSL